MSDCSRQLQQAVQQAVHDNTPLTIEAGGSKRFIGEISDATVLSVAEHRGIVDYQPTELVLTARAGTLLSEIEQLLAEHQQMLPFEPPHFGHTATLGGTIACGLSGPSRPFTGSARDFVLGCKIINGRGEILHFGGQVIKNVAGYDVSRLMVGAMGELGVLLEISLKVLPLPALQLSLSQTRENKDALRLMQTLRQQHLPLTGLAYDGNAVQLRLAGAAASVNAARKKLGGEQQHSDRFWQQLKEQQHAFFDGDQPLWRLSLPPACPALDLPGKQLIDWGGALRWLKADMPAEQVFKLAAKHGGHAQCFRYPTQPLQRHQPLSRELLALQQRIKLSFDPQRLFNRGRLYPEL